MHSAVTDPHAHLQAQVRWQRVEIAFWLCTLAPFVAAPAYLQLASQIAITALFALSLDLILGYAGIVSLGHAAFFGLGAYAAGLLSKHAWGEPLSGLLIASAVPGPLRDRVGCRIPRRPHVAPLLTTPGRGPPPLRR